MLLKEFKEGTGKPDPEPTKDNKKSEEKTEKKADDKTEKKAEKTEAEAVKK